MKPCIPSTWRTVCFGDVVCNVKVDVDPETSGLERYIAGEHMETDNLHIRQWGTIGDGYLGPAFHRKFVKGQVLYGSRRTYLRKVAVAEFDGVCANTTFVLDAKEDVLLQELLPFIMQTEGFTQHSILHSKGSVNPYVNWKDIACYEFPLPSLNEQHRIADILWAADASLERYNAVLETLKQLKRSLWHESVAMADWPTVNLGEVAEVSNGTTPSKANPGYWEGGTIPWLPTQKVHDRIITRADDFITELALQETSIRLLPRGSVLIAMIGQGKTRGSVAYLAIEACINQNFACAVPCEEVDSWYLFYCLDGSYDRLRSSAQGSVQALNCRIIQKFTIPLPPKEQQLSIAYAFRIIELTIRASQDHILKTNTLKKSLLERLLAPNRFS